MPRPSPKGRTARHRKAVAAEENAYNARRNRDARRRAREGRSALDRDRARPVNRMTGWQRNQWARAGYPKARIAELAALERQRAA